MAEPSLHSHLSDPSLTPLLTTARSQSTISSLTSLTSTALTAHSTSHRLNMGAPCRLLVEDPDRLVLTSFLSPQSLRVDADSSVSGVASEAETHGTEGDRQREEGSKDEEPGPPMLVALVSAPVGEGKEARRAAARLEKVGRELQKEWTANGEGTAEAG
ncbi:hypothetical protein VUR80DRAFT_2192 [Thermomyces stellatus]